VADASAGALARLRALAQAYIGLPLIKKRPSSSVSNRPKAVRPNLQYHQRLLRFGVGSDPQDVLQNGQDEHGTQNTYTPAGKLPAGLGVLFGEGGISNNGAST
jgi:hypothetical protein